jgi:hypothetical protein
MGSERPSVPANPSRQPRPRRVRRYRPDQGHHRHDLPVPSGTRARPMVVGTVTNSPIDPSCRSLFMRTPNTRSPTASSDTPSPAANISRRDTVLISGATGGVGSIAVQLASARNARVIATARGEEQASFVRDLGAEHAVDHQGAMSSQMRELSPKGVDAVLRSAGDASQLLEVLKRCLGGLRASPG